MPDTSTEAEPSMQRVRRLALVWSWLPAFRVVGEVEHLPTAARRLSTSASALSRSIKLLEEAVGAPLFLRVGRRLVLSEEGRVLLDGVRDAMRLLDDALDDVRGERMVGALRFAADAAVRGQVLDAALALSSAHEKLTLIERPLPDDLERALLRGELDLAVVVDPAISTRGLDVRPLFDVRFVAATRDGEPRAKKRRASHAPRFASYPGDPWPTASPRSVAVACADVHGAALAALEQGLAVMHPLPLPAGLAEVPGGPARSLPVVAVMRRALRPGGRAERLAQALAEAKGRGPHAEA